MRLWTWQKRGLDITNESTSVESLKNSIFLRGDSCFKTEYSHFKDIYKKLFKKLGTDQFHWYFTEEFEAKNNASHVQFFSQDMVLWEVEVPDEEIFKKVCDIAWCYLLNRHIFPLKLYNHWKIKSEYDAALIKIWEQDFRNFWASKSEHELWSLLFLENIIDGCTQVLLRHPLDKFWIIHNPTVEDKWWNTVKANDYSQGTYTCTLPCKKCSGHNQHV